MSASSDVLAAAWTAIGVWAIGMPLAHLSLVQSGLLEGDALTRDYRPDRRWWEAVVVLEKLTLTGFFFSTNIHNLFDKRATIVRAAFVFFFRGCEDDRRPGRLARARDMPRRDPAATNSSNVRLAAAGCEESTSASCRAAGVLRRQCAPTRCIRSTLRSCGADERSNLDCPRPGPSPPHPSAGLGCPGPHGGARGGRSNDAP